MTKGTFCISLDLELLWGRPENYHIFVDRAKKVRLVVKKLLALFVKYNIPATWAIVGKLISKPSKNVQFKNLWYAPDLLRLIKATPTHEIASHSFTHPEFDKISKQAAENELLNCVSAAKKQGVVLRSFVFPRNKVAHLNILKKHGIRSFRGAGPVFPFCGTVFEKVYELMDYILLTPQTGKPSRKSGLLNIPGTMYFLSARGMRKYLPVSVRVLKAKAGIKKAVENRELFHLWFHPIDLAEETEKLLFGLEEIVKYAAKLRSAKQLEIKTMAQIESRLTK